MFASKRESTAPKPPTIHRRVVSTGSTPRLFPSPPSISMMRKLSKSSRQEQKCRQAPSAHMEHPDHKEATGGPGFFVNPPLFRVDNHDTTTSCSATSSSSSSPSCSHKLPLGVPMIGQCSDFLTSTATSLHEKPNGPKRVVSTGSAPAAQRQRAHFLVNPPAFESIISNSGGRARKTLGVPMV